MSAQATCPNCKEVMDTSVGVDDNGFHNSQPSPGDYSLCTKCLSFLRFNDKLELVGMDVQDVADMPDAERITLTRIRKMLEEGRLIKSKSGELPVDPDFVQRSDQHMVKMIRTKLLPELQEIFGADMELVVVVRLKGAVGAYCGGKKMNALLAAKLLQDGARRMAEKVLEDMP
jgi:hypothetical protein